MNAIVPFQFGDEPIRIYDRDGHPWFVLVDVCRVLGIGNPSDAAKRLDEDERDALDITDPIGRTQSVTIVNESGLWSLVLTSRKPAAKTFKKWITAEVLPSLRRTGSFGVPTQPMLPRDPRELLSYITQQAGDMVELQDSIAALQPKAEALDRFAAAEGSLAPTAAAKTLGVRPGRLFDWLEHNGWLYRGADGLLGRQTKIDQGLVEHKALTLDRGRRTPKVVTQALITAKGLARLAELRAGL